MTRPAVRAQNHAGDVRSKVARIGLFGKGALYALLGFLAINVALGNRSSDGASEVGAIQTVAQAPLGKFLLIALTAALIALVVWLVTQAISGDPIEGSDGSHRAKCAAKAVLYSGAALASLSVLIANWGGNAETVPGGSGDGKQHATAAVMGLPGGQWIVMLAGLAAIAFGGYEIYKHTVNRDFMKRLGQLDYDKRRPVEALGRAGYAGSGLVTIGVGFFLVVAGLTFDPDEAKGLSGLLAELAGQSWGQLVLWLIAIGLFAYGLFSFAEARYRPVT
ncbi:DUF1206 domain-containing protein [Mycobacterium bourgelatii]|uniref:DUF1206 domain-containing protein n=1 Tax=Mycobacterium bourgelatii TaxID=1273442 RepID=A0A7I9YXX9_MYCBU|nr:DUF1206 domain-containing protein [Mycobacterium bourgelatii]MCV6977326.1 DUF1206 domain-containing protein [Mycobacterium bourgelatii]GFG93599.1 hypothetical protein MBOU_56410 [Mycobacterium bourgelatii]